MHRKPEIFVQLLKQRLSETLPGLSSQMKMVPEERRKEIESRNPTNRAKKAAVLICFFPDGYSNIHLVLIRRNEYDGVHSGQISFPGGRYEDNDRNMVKTALREAEEETNIKAKDVEVLGEDASGISLRAYPNEIGVPPADGISRFFSEKGRPLKAFWVEGGRLDEVFRMITTSTPGEKGQ